MSDVTTGTPTTDAAVVVQRLAGHRMIGTMPSEELEWLAARGSLQLFRAGEFIVRKGDPLTHLYVTLTGRFVIALELASGRTTLLETRAGDVTGALPYSRATNVVGDVRVEEDMEILAIPVESFPEMIRECPNLVARLVQRMVDRARTHSSARMQDERLKSLGRLAAGLAHELDNPASAALRGAQALRESLVETAAAASALDAAGLSSDQRDLLTHAMRAARGTGVYSAMERADRHDTLVEWLESHGLATEPADALADSTVATADLDRLAATAGGATLGCMVRALAAEQSAAALAGSIESAVTRIHDMVSSVRRFTSLGRAPGAEQLDLAQGLHDVVAVHATKARTKGVRISLAVPADLPPVVASEDLNQAWADLLDNAIDAAGERGDVEVHATVDREEVVVQVIDSGPGIPPEVEARMFEPFFTTKPQGQGLGLGLDTVRRIVLANEGRISAESRPGRTEFRVVLPLAAPGT